MLLSSAPVSELIDQSTLISLVQAGTVRTAELVGRPGGWEVVVKNGRKRQALGLKRGNTRKFRDFATLVKLLKSIGLNEYRMDASQYDPNVVVRTNPSAAKRLKDTYAAAAHDKWFREEVAEAVKEADDPATKWVSAKDADATWAKKRAALLKLAGSST